MLESEVHFILNVSLSSFSESGCPFRIRHLDDVLESDVSHLQRKETERKFQYDHFDADDHKLANQLLRGGVDLDNLPCQDANVVRMFVCSSGPGIKLGFSSLSK